MNTLTTVLDVVAATLVLAGLVGLAITYLPAALISAGLLLGAVSWRLERGA